MGGVIAQYMAMAELARYSHVSTEEQTESVAVDSPRGSLNNSLVLNEPMMALSWYHPFLTRHSAECMLIDNAREGTFLLRPSSSGKSSEYVLSAKYSHSVQHMKLTQLPDRRYQFGHSSFVDVLAIKKHFEQEKPVVGGENGINVVLKLPYLRDIDETHLYLHIHHHSATRPVESDSDSDCDNPSKTAAKHCDTIKTLDRLKVTTPISSKEGYLTKLGYIRKTWKVRWFVLRNVYLSYFKTKQSPKPIRILNMLEALHVEYDYSTGKDFCFRIQFRKRTFSFFANSSEECEQWVELLRSKVVCPQHETEATSSGL